MTINSIQLLFSIAMMLGNPFFDKIPKIIDTANESVSREQLVKYLVRACRIYFGKEVGEWI